MTCQGDITNKEQSQHLNLGFLYFVLHFTMWSHVLSETWNPIYIVLLKNVEFQTTEQVILNHDSRWLLHLSTVK